MPTKCVLDIRTSIIEARLCHELKQVQGVSVLFGIIYGEARKGPKAYNWYLTRDMCSLAFFDAQTGEEYSAAALDGFGFEPTVINF